MPPLLASFGDEEAELWIDDVICLQCVGGARAQETLKGHKEGGTSPRSHSDSALGQGFTEDLFHSLLGGYCCSNRGRGGLPHGWSSMSLVLVTRKRAP